MKKLEQMRGEIPSKHCSSFIDIDLKYVLFKKNKNKKTERYLVLHYIACVSGCYS